MKICIVGGGSAGWMSATTFVRKLDADVTLIESPDVPVSGVGESTLGAIQEWLEFIGATHGDDIVKKTGATLKQSIKFTNFLKKDSGSFHYPFGNTVIDPAMWWSRYIHTGKGSHNDYGVDVNPLGLSAEDGRIDTSSIYAYHFDAIKFGQYLKDEYCSQVNHVVANVIGCRGEIDSLQLDNGESIEADLFVDCTGFKSLLLGQFLKEPFISYRKMLPNDRAWATHVPYGDKKKQMVPYTECTAIDNGWVWQIPLWENIGTGYVYSSRYISDEDAKQQFIEHLTEKGFDTSNCDFTLIPMKVGRRSRVFVNNVVAVGLSSGFIEPLESNSLLTVHDNLIELYKILRRGQPSQVFKDNYNEAIGTMLDQWSQFIAIHYAYTQRQDTPYWKDIFNKGYQVKETKGVYSIKDYGREMHKSSRFVHSAGGYHYIASGMNVCPYYKAKYSASECEKLDVSNKNWKDNLDKLPLMYDLMHQVRENES